MGMKLAALSADPEKKGNKSGNACEIDVVQTARPGGICKQNCIHCGASGEHDRGPQIQLSREELEENLSREVSSNRAGVRNRILANYLAPYATTDVDVEPTDGDAFIDAAELVHGLSDGRSRMLCISHGLRSYIKPKERSQGHLIGQALSLFDGGDVYARYTNDSWVACLLWVDGLEIDQEVKDRVFQAFVNQVYKSIDSDKDIEEKNEEVCELVLGLPFSEKFDEIVTKLWSYANDETHFLSSNNLMMGRLEMVDELKGKGVLEEVCPSADGKDCSAKRLDKIVELMQKGVVPGFILTVDFARAAGRITLENNMASYVKTLNCLKPTLSRDARAFVAISIQGLQGEDVSDDHPYSATRAHVFFQEALRRSALTGEEQSRLKYDTGRQYAKVGRSAEDPLLEKFLTEDDACEVIPYQQFVDEVVAPNRPLLRGRVRADGAADYQHVQRGRTYNATVKGPWTQFLDVPPIRRYTREGSFRALSTDSGTSTIPLTQDERERRERLNWEDYVKSEGDIFLFKPFSLIKRGEDREKLLSFVRGVFGVDDVCKFSVTEAKGALRPIRFSDLKLQIIKACFPQNDVGGKIAEASPYKQVVGEISSTGESVGVVLGQENYLSGEVMLLAKVLQERLGFDYIVDQLDAIYKVEVGQKEEAQGKIE
jgi:hypothetical protein